MRRISLTQLLAEYLPGSYDQPWDWEDEATDIMTRVCLCCEKEGHYQFQIVERMRSEGEWWKNDPLLAPILGNDGRVWDGHHRILGAVELGWVWITVDEAIWRDFEPV